MRGLSLPGVFHFEKPFTPRRISLTGVFHRQKPFISFNISLATCSRPDHWVCDGADCCLPVGGGEQPGDGDVEHYCCVHEFDLCLPCARRVLSSSASSAIPLCPRLPLLTDAHGREVLDPSELVLLGIVPDSKVSNCLAYRFILESICPAKNADSECVRVQRAPQLVRQPPVARGAVSIAITAAALPPSTCVFPGRPWSPGRPGALRRLGNTAGIRHAHVFPACSWASALSRRRSPRSFITAEFLAVMLGSPNPSCEFSPTTSLRKWYLAHCFLFC